MFRRSTPAFVDRRGRTINGSVAALEPVEIGGVRQWLLVRGVDTTQPVLLYLHGGPGNAEIVNARRHQAELERAFVVANWDQRGAGLSYSPGIPRDSMTLERMVEDTVEVSRWIARRFGQDRIVLAGHSFGSILGLLAARRAPELYRAYIGIAQVVEPEESERRMLRWSLEEAKRRSLARAVRELEGIGEPPYADRGAFRVVRRWARRFGGMIHTGSESAILLDTLLHLREYTLWDAWNYGRGEVFSVESLVEETSRVDMARLVTRLSIPAYFVFGRFDRVCDPALAREYLEVLDAPRKGWAWIEDAAHLAPFEQPDAVAAALAHFAQEAGAQRAPAWRIAG